MTNAGFLVNTPNVYIASTNRIKLHLQVEELLQDSDGVVRRLHSVANGSWVGVDLPVVTTLVGLVAEEVDLLEALVLHVLKSVGLVPAGREHVKGDLAANGVGQAVVGKVLLESIDKGLSDLVLLVVLFKLVSLLGRGVSAHRRYVDHTVSELNKSASSDGNVDVGQVAQDELDKLVVLVVADPVDERLRRKLLTQLVSGQAVFRKTVVEVLQHALAQLLHLLGQVTATNKANHHLLSQGLQSFSHLVGDLQPGGSQSSVNIEQH